MTIRHLKLHHFPMTRSARVKWLLHEVLDDDFEVQLVGLYAGEQYQDAFLALNPNHAVPVLEVTPAQAPPFVMFESGAIIAWLADVYADAALAPAARDSHARADYLQMLHFGASWFDMMLWQLRLHVDLWPDDRRSEDVVASFRKKIRREVEPQLMARLERDGFAAGTRFSAADCVLGHNVRWSRLYGLCTDASFSRYLQRLEGRPAYRKAFADAGDFTPKPPPRTA